MARWLARSGKVTRGPAVYDQPAYQIRAAEGSGFEVPRAAS